MHLRRTARHLQLAFVIMLAFDPITETQRGPDDPLGGEFERARQHILGALVAR